MRHTSTVGAGRTRLGLLEEPVVAVHALNRFVAHTSAWNERLLLQRAQLLLLLQEQEQGSDIGGRGLMFLPLPSRSSTAALPMWHNPLTEETLVVHL